jgi:hypothetical protein
MQWTVRLAAWTPIEETHFHLCDTNISLDLFNSKNLRIAYFRQKYIPSYYVKIASEFSSKGILFVCHMQLLLPKLFNYLAFQSFNFERTWWKLFQKDVVRTKFDIYVFITITGPIPLLVTISPRGYHPPSSQCFYHWADTSAGNY